jgi:hypothetical protein
MRKFYDTTLLSITDHTVLADIYYCIPLPILYSLWDFSKYLIFTVGDDPNLTPKESELFIVLPGLNCCFSTVLNHRAW